MLFVCVFVARINATRYAVVVFELRGHRLRDCFKGHLANCNLPENWGMKNLNHNFTGVIFFKKMSTFPFFQKSLMGPRGQRRFHALISAPLFLMSIISNFYFLMGKDIGYIFLVKGFTSWPIGTPTILFFMYCGAQTSIEVKNWEIRREMAKIPSVD